MRRLSYALLACLFAFGLLGACDDVLDGICTPNDALTCTNRATDCRNELDSESETYEADAAECTQNLCDCLDNTGCDEYINDSDCN
ncbi:MAG: hypothetical protein GY762_19990 [Proteobacteria bacterium]|nr:hypothetical protein [Pseudomonadota bacterium]